MRDSLIGRVPLLTAALSLAISAAFVPAAADDEIAWDRADKKWRHGPVRYLLTKDEDKEYKGLKGDAAMEAYVKAFWERRDPTPGTPENEYREAFYTNAREAAARFTEDGGKGWQDDRGRIYILLGPPDDIIEEEGLVVASDASIPDAATGGFGATGSTSTPQSPTRTVKFVYLQDPLSGEGHRELSFRGDVTGGFRLIERMDWDQPILRGLAAPMRQPPPPVAAIEAPPVPPAPPTVPAVPEIAEPEVIAPTPQSELMDLVRGAPDTPSGFPLQLNVNYYKARGESTAATITIELHKKDLPAGIDPSKLIVSAEVLDPATGESIQRFFQDDHFGFSDPTPGADGAILFQSQRSFLPGSYQAYFAVKDETTGKIGVLKENLTVPDYQAEDLVVSTVTLAHKLEQIDSPPDAEQFEPFVLGNFKVVPRSEHRYHHGEELIFYYQIYGASNDASGKPKVDLAYAFEKKHGGRWIMLGREPITLKGQEALVQAYGLTIQPSFPGGDYRVRIEVTDTIGGQTRKIEVPFAVDAPEKTVAK